MESQKTPLSPTEANVQRCIELLLDGGLVALPTETVYGLAGNGLDEGSIRKIFSVKGRPLIDPLIVHVLNLEAANACASVPPEAETLAERFWPGPLTMVLRKTPRIPALATAGLPSVALRSPRHRLFRRILEGTNIPLVAPSANPFGYVSPTRANHVAHTLGHRIAAILDGGPCECGIESTIVDLRVPHEPKVLRPGPITVEALTATLRRPVREAAAVPIDHPQVAPGTLRQHYSPNTQVVLADRTSLEQLAANSLDDDETAILFISRPTVALTGEHLFWLTEKPEFVDEAAANLYDLLQRLDQQGFQQIIVETPPQEGLWNSLRDRLQRAAAKG